MNLVTSSIYFSLTYPSLSLWGISQSTDASLTQTAILQFFWWVSEVFPLQLRDIINPVCPGLPSLGHASPRRPEICDLIILLALFCLWLRLYSLVVITAGSTDLTFVIQRDLHLLDQTEALS